MRKKLALSLLSILALTVSCNGGGKESTTDPSTDNTGTSEENKLTATEGLSTKEAIASLADDRAKFSFTVEIVSDPSEFGSSDSPSTFVYSSDYFTKYTNGTTDFDTGYLVENGGVSSFKYNIYDDVLIRSELLKDSEGNNITSLEDVAPSFKSISLAGLEEKDGVIDISKKKAPTFKLFEILEIPHEYYFSLEYLKAYTTGNHSQNDLIFEAKIKATSSTPAVYYMGSVSRFGRSGVGYLDTFLANPSPAFEPSETAKRVRTLFRNNNYTQYRDNNGDDTLDQMDYFTDQYYYVDFTEEYKGINPSEVAQYGNKGYLAISNVTMNYTASDGTVTPLVFIGTYLFSLTDDNKVSIVTRPDPSNPYYAQSSFKQIYTDITKVMNYPGKMLCFDSFQIAEENNGIISYNDSIVLNDFVTNFNLSELLQGYGYKAERLDIIPTLNDEDKDCEVKLRLYVNETNYFEYIFKDFNNTKIDAVEQFISENGLRM